MAHPSPVCPYCGRALAADGVDCEFCAPYAAPAGAAPPPPAAAGPPPAPAPPVWWVYRVPRRAWFAAAAGLALLYLVPTWYIVTGSDWLASLPLPEFQLPQRPVVTAPPRPVRPPGENYAGLPIEQLTPVESGPGVVVCDPVLEGGSKSGRAFADGCVRWLQLALASQPSLGRCPMWNSVDRSRTHIKKADLRFNAADAARLSRCLGNTHVVLAGFSGDDGSGTLTLELVEVPSKKPVGAAVRLSGSPDEVAARLPAAARELCHRLGAAEPRLPQAEQAEALRFVGGLPRFPEQGLSTERSEKLRARASGSPLALFYRLLERGQARDMDAGLEAARELKALYPDSPLVLAQIGYAGALQQMDPDADSYLTPIRASLQTYPHNFLLRTTEYYMNAAKGDYAGQRRAAEWAVRCSPRSGLGWRNLGRVLQQRANVIRQSRAINEMTREELQEVGALYSQEMPIRQRAAEVDPEDATIRLELSMCAGFHGDQETAHEELAKAIELQPDLSHAYMWGLQLYQRKWGGNPADLTKMARTTATAPIKDPKDRQTLAVDLYQLGYWSEARRMPRGADEKAAFESWVNAHGSETRGYR